MITFFFQNLPKNVLWIRKKERFYLEMISFFFLPSTNKTMVANPFSGGFLRTKYKRLDSTWIKCVPINANHKLSERHFQSWGWEHSCLNAWIPLALISVLLVQRNENRKEFLFFFFSFAFTRRTKEKAPTCVKRCVFLFLLPNKSEFCTVEMSLLIRRCNGWTKADFFWDPCLWPDVISNCVSTALVHLFLSLLWQREGGHCQQACQLSSCKDIQFTGVWTFFLGNANTIEPFQQLLGAVFPRQSWPSELFILSRKLLEMREETFCQEFQHSVSVFIGFYIWNGKCLLKRHAIEEAVDLCWLPQAG